MDGGVMVSGRPYTGSCQTLYSLLLCILAICLFMKVFALLCLPAGLLGSALPIALVGCGSSSYTQESTQSLFLQSGPSF